MTGSYRYRVGPPLINKLVMKPMNYSCWGYVYQLSYRLGAPPCMRMRAFQAASGRDFLPDLLVFTVLCMTLCLLLFF